MLRILIPIGLGFFVMPFALPALRRRWRDDEAGKPALFFLLIWGGAFLLLTLYELRFQLYLAVPLALWVAVALRDLAARVAERFPSSAVAGRAVHAAAVLLVAAPALPFVFLGNYAEQQPGF